MKIPGVVLLLVGALLIMSACGGGSSQNQSAQSPPVTPPSAQNFTTCSGQQVPNWRAPAFTSNYKTAISKLVSHYGSNPNIGYIRIGIGRGGEINLPQGWNDTSTACGQAFAAWGYTAGADASYTWNAYLKDMVQYEGSLNSPKKLLVSITPITGVGASVDDFLAPIAVNASLAFGNQGLQSSDITNYTANQACGGDWCNLFNQYTGQVAPLELQTLGQSCPPGAACSDQLSTLTGPLPPLLQFAVARHATSLELYYEDWLIAYNPNDPNHAANGASYQSAIETAGADPGVSLQVLFPPTTSGNPAYLPVQSYLLNNPVVDGAVFAVSWSDFDKGNGVYDFSITDAAIQPWINANKKVNLTLQNTTYGGSSCPGSGSNSNGSVGSNCAMPPWMWTLLGQ